MQQGPRFASGQKGPGFASKPIAPNPASKPLSVNDFISEDLDADLDAFQDRGRKPKKKKKNKNNTDEPATYSWESSYDPGKGLDMDKWDGSDADIHTKKKFYDAMRLANDKKHGRVPEVKSSSDSPSEEGSYTVKAPLPCPTLTKTGHFGLGFSAANAASPPHNAASIADDATGDDAYARRMRMSQAQNLPTGTPPDSSDATSPPVTTSARTYSAAPVYYNNAPPSDEPPISDLEKASQDEGSGDKTSDAPVAAAPDNPSSKRPGQQGAVQRMMEKMGYKKGQGLGASGEGIINPLEHKVGKRKAGPAIAQIVGGDKRRKIDDAEDESATDSPAIVVRGMVDGTDIDRDRKEGHLAHTIGLVQQIGTAMEKMAGPAERIVIHADSKSESKPVYIKFTTLTSAFVVTIPPPPYLSKFIACLPSQTFLKEPYIVLLSFLKDRRILLLASVFDLFIVIDYTTSTLDN